MFQLMIQMESSNAAPSQNWGALMHGMLIEHLRGAWPAILHQDSARPISQWIEPLDQKRLVWHVNLLDDQLGVCFLEACQEGDEWYCQHNGSKLQIRHMDIRSETIADYIDRKMNTPRPSRELLLSFKTVTTHKSGGKYVLFPSVELISGSLRNRLRDLYEEYTVPDELLSLLTENTAIQQYHLQSANFGLEGSWVRGYVGQLQLRVNGNEETGRFGNMLYGLAPWFGIGIKTALGMGGCLISNA